MESLGWKLFKDPSLTYELAAGDAKIALNSISQKEQTITVYFGAWDSYDPETKTYRRRKITLEENDTFQWTLVRNVDDGMGGTVEVPAIDYVKSVSVTSPDEDNVIELSPNNPVSNFYYKSQSDKKLTSTDDYILWPNFNAGSFKYGWSTATNAEAGGFRLAKRDPNDPANEILMTREMRYGSGVTHPDRFTTFNHGDSLPTDGWYIKDFWAYTYPNDDNDDLQSNDIIPRVRTIQSGIANRIRMDITFALPDGASGTGVDFNYILYTLPIVNALFDEIDL